MRTLVYAELAPALACAGVTQMSFLFKQRGACAARPVRFGRPLESGKALLCSPWFAIGMAASAVAWLLHLLAIAAAPLSAVQAVLASGVIILAVLGRVWFGWTISRRQWQGITLTAVSLVLLVVTLPAPRVPAATGPATLLFVVVGIGVAGAFVVGARLGAPTHSQAAMLGAAAGTLLGVSDVANKALIQLAGGGVGAVLASPWVIVTAFAGVSAFLVSGRAFQEHDPVPAMACASTAANLTAMVGGIAVFGEKLAGDVLLGGMQVLAFVVIAGAALMMVSRRAVVSGAIA
jgi:hypothetical protein